MSRFAPQDVRDIARLIEAEVLGIVTTHDALGFIATPLPLLAECDDRGQVRQIVGHFARGNPHVARAEQCPSAQITFLGPHGYISPSMVSQNDWAPTWNYRFAQFEVEIEFEPAHNDAAIRALVARMEGVGDAAWSVERVGPRYERLIANVVAFRAHVRRATARFKLGQDENRKAFDEIVASLSGERLAQAMVEQRSE
jgi:transcriptional regulator